ncbi:flagellar protein FlaF [Rhodoblastus acidophilus]|uniref:Flagellar protein FlaF n=1 Tax=Rhodoblastus acidophilus TaxID=1074 RepID=A0A212RQS5_RHOAC|nr:flagellar biosynthesis regulator FlaF [Rhodoblastus acidophilus]MCW2316219.1 flagellar protein FlaF [Rhodoblastus acidophilus]PPQ38563.1 flagellar biosynthesis regulator FlhF [Rhodoblastus acidophilus]RAI21876.1 flagellar biosynthesis regulator FlhF [Rhodoblastus acidophilus]SNB74951.1 flagellar protein FlaF [Rhodoblastus acidophilus]
MYQFTYAEVVEDSPQEMRARERDALSRAVELLQRAKEAGAGSPEASDALVYTRRLWSIFLDDLGSAGNELPEALRAQLISIGIWIVKEIERVRSGAADDFSDLIEINAIIRDGLV